MNSKLQIDRDKFVSIRNLYNSMFRAKKASYYKDFVSNNSSSTKTFWNKLNPFLNPNKKQKITTALLSSKESNISSPQELVNSFSNYFSTILNKYKFYSINSCLGYLHHLFNTNSNLALLNNASKPKFELAHITPDLVKVKLARLNSKSAPGFAGIETRIFKECNDELKSVISDLYNGCVKSNSFPDEWKISYITPIYKGKGKQSNLENYRPISIISPIAKVFEAILGANIRNFLESNHILHQDQNGFREGRSCHHALNTIVDFCKLNLDAKKHVIAIFLDLSKAYDTVDHELLLAKLSYYGFGRDAIDLIKNYLSNRFSIVYFGNKLSKKEKLEKGVPQGSVLGPLLFIIFFNDFASSN